MTHCLCGPGNKFIVLSQLRINQIWCVRFEPGTFVVHGQTTLKVGYRPNLYCFCFSFGNFSSVAFARFVQLPRCIRGVGLYLWLTGLLVPCLRINHLTADF